MSSASDSPTPQRHALWVRVSHWILALSIFALAYSGFYILLAHPRLYWGEVGNDLTPAWLELPLNDNHQPQAWKQTVTFSALANQPISASRTNEIFNQNGWARSLHFLAGWFLVAAGALYVALGVVTRHVSRDLWPGRAGAYSSLQRFAYTGVAFVVLPFMVLAGLAMSPQVLAAVPALHVLGGHQSARTLHFFGFVVILAFVVGHLAMVLLTGFGRHMRAMIVGR
jgi:thiosulfate reductase cytochrome b subunit